MYRTEILRNLQFPPLTITFYADSSEWMKSIGEISRNICRYTADRIKIEGSTVITYWWTGWDWMEVDRINIDDVVDVH